YHFKDGTPVTENSFNGGKSQYAKEGQPTKVAIPSNKGPGFERVTVSPDESSKLGEELRKTREDVREVPQDMITLNGEQYNIYELKELNDRIMERYNNENLVMTY
ncbi:MAG: hypothetical protein ACOCZ5_02760, partial [bacterium]